MKKNRRIALAAAMALLLTVAFPLSAGAEVQRTVITAPSSEVPMVADAALYRGIVVEAAQGEGSEITFTLRQAEGTNYGSRELVFRTGESTYLGCDADEIQVGAYLEVAYGGVSQIYDFQEALTVKKLTDASLSVFNGQFVSTQGDSGSLLLKDLKTGNEMIFHISDNTQVYLDRGKLKAGDKVNVYFSGASTRSIPPQATALEIRAYADTAVYRGIISGRRTQDGGEILTLKRAAGTDFADSQEVLVTQGTNANAPLGEIKNGDYVEVLFERSTGIPFADSLKKLNTPEMCVSSVVLKSVTQKTDKPGYGSILVTNLDNSGEVVYHYGPETVFKKELSTLKAGDQLSIYHRSIFALSLPPQGSALEISNYKK